VTYPGEPGPSRIEHFQEMTANSEDDPRWHSGKLTPEQQSDLERLGAYSKAAVEAVGPPVPSSDQIMILDRADDAKYVIFKVEDWDDLINEINKRFADKPHHMASILKMVAKVMVDDGTVIRRQEFFAAPALHAYAYAIDVAIKAMRSDRGGYNEGTVQNLRAIADYFHTQAALAEEEGYKIPD